MKAEVKHMGKGRLILKITAEPHLEGRDGGVDATLMRAFVGADEGHGLRLSTVSRQAARKNDVSEFTIEWTRGKT